MANTASGGPLVRFGDFHLDLHSGELSQNGSRVLLPDQPFRLLAILIRQRGALVTREDLRRELWPEGTFVDFEPSLNAAVKRVRDALGDSAATPQFIETVPKRGYRFIAPVYDVPNITDELARAESGSASIPTPNEPAKLASATESPADFVRGRATGPTNRIVRVRLTWIDLVLLLGFVAVGIVLYKSGGHVPLAERADPVLRLTNDGTVRLAAVSLDGRDLAYVRQEGIRESLWLKRGDNPTPSRLLEPTDGTFRSLTFAPGDVLHYTLFRPDKTLVQPFRLSTRGGSAEAMLEPAGRISFSHDGSRYAYVSSFSLALRESRIVVSDSVGGDPRVITVRRPPESFLRTLPAWSPDGSRLVVFGVTETAPASRELLVIDVASGRLLTASQIRLTVVDGALWLPDGQTVLISGRQRSATPQRLWLFALSSETLRPLTTDVSDYRLVGLSGGGQRVVAVRGEVARSLWVADLHATDAPRQVAQNSGDLEGLEGLAWSSNEHILYTAAESGNVDIWSVNREGHMRRQLTSDPADDFHPSATADGGTVVFASNRGGSPGIWTMGGDGSNQRRLTSGADIRPSISRDGRMLVFQRGAVDTTPFTLWRLAMGDTEPKQIADNHSMRPAVSSDALSIAHYLMTAEAWLLAITPLAGGPPARILPISPTHATRVVRWSADGRALAFIDGAGGASNIWMQPLDGEPAQKLTGFSEGRITSFDWSPDGSRLAWTRVNEVRDVVTVDLAIDGNR
jgi:Tol biopolymer transport system component/DNA-binding winged helix-turn-helix (wHTH) protein